MAILPIRDRTQIHSVLTPWTVIPVERTDLHFSTPERPWPRHGGLGGFPCIMGLLIAQVLQITFALRFAGFDLAACLDIDGTLQSVAEVRVVNGQCCGLRFGSFFGVYRLINSFFDPVSQCGKAVILQQHNTMVWLEGWFRFGARQS